MFESRAQIVVQSDQTLVRDQDYRKEVLFGAIRSIKHDCWYPPTCIRDTPIAQDRQYQDIIVLRGDLLELSQCRQVLVILQSVAVMGHSCGTSFGCTTHMRPNVSLIISISA